MLRGLFDFHIGENVSEIRLDLEAYMAQVKRLRIGALAFMTKDAMGTSYYATKFGRRNRHIERDLFGEAVESAHRRGIELFGYYNVSLNDYLGQEHPDWRQVDAQGKADYVFRQYTGMCLNSPYRQVVRGQLEELAGNYQCDGLWLDITYVFASRCYCEHCRRRFQQEHGFPMPEAPAAGSTELAALLDFRRQTRFNYLEELVSAVRRIRGPRFPVVWNHAGDIDFGQVEADRLASLSACEFHSPDFDDGYFKCNFMRPLGKLFELMMPECLYGWGQWTVVPLATMKTMAAVALSEGACLNLGHVAIPSGPLAGAVADAVVNQYGAMSDWMQTRQAWCDGAVSQPCAAVLSSVANQRLASCLRGTLLVDEPAPRSVRGAHRILLDCHWPVDLLGEDSPGELSRYEVVVLPETVHVPLAMTRALHAYVECGGNLIVEGASGSLDAQGQPLADFALADLTGTHLAGRSGLTNRYLAELAANLADGLPKMPILVHGDDAILNVTADADCQVLSTFMDPEYEATPQRHIYHQHGHPAVPTTHPAITLRRVGRGKVAHVVAPVSDWYMAKGHPWMRKLMGNLMRAMVADPFVQVTGGPSIRVTAMTKATAKGTQRLIHLVHWHQEPHTAGPSFVEEEMTVSGTVLSVRSPAPSRVLQIGDDVKNLSWDGTDGRVTIALAPWQTHALVVIEE